MELLLGSHVREHGRRVGHLAGFELEPANLRIRRIIFSPDGDLGPHAMTRPAQAIARLHDDGEIELGSEAAVDPMPAVRDVVLLSGATRLRQLGRAHGRLVGVEIDPADRRLRSVLGRHHWWSRRFSQPAATADVSTPGEIRLDTGGSRAA